MSTPTHEHVQAVLASEAYRRAIAVLERDHDRLVAETIRLQQIPAPFRGEAEKGRAFAAMLAEAGLRDVATDAEGNVSGIRPGRTSGGPLVALVSHLDTVFEAGTDLTVRRDGTRIVAPGIADNTRGVAAQLALARAMAEADIAHEADVLFVGSVGEEGLGDLRGVKHLLGAGPYRNRIATFIGLDGSSPERIVNEAVGSRRYVLRFRGPGGHSYGAFGTVNPMYALANAMAALARIEAPHGSTYSVGLAGGGTSINAIPLEAWCQVDLRSTVPADLDGLDGRFRAIARQAASGENAARSTAHGAITAELEPVGDRPCGRTDPSSDLVRIACAAVAAHGWTPVLEASSTDANVPISLGIPAVTIASGIGGRAHSLDEFLDVEPGQSLRQLGMALTVLLAVAGAAPSAVSERQ